MFISSKRANTYAGLALVVLLEASCASGGGGLVPGNSTVNDSSLAKAGGAQAARPRKDSKTNDVIVACNIVTPTQKTVLNPPPAQTFTMPPSFNPSGYVFYFAIGIGNWCYSLPQTVLYSTVPGSINASNELAFEAGHNKVVLKAGQSYVYVAYGVPAKPAKHLYLIDHGTSDVSVWLTGSNGNVAPLYRIKNVGGPHGAPQGIAEDAQGYIYVTAIAADGYTTSVLVFKPGAQGDAKPVRIITGPDTTLTANSSDTGVGPDGSIYVNNGNGIAVFAPNAAGDAAPARLITGLNGGGAAVTLSDILYTSTAIGSSKLSMIDAFGPTANGPATPLYSLAGSKANPSGKLVGVDSQGNIYQCRNKAVIEFAPYQAGNVNPIRFIHGGNLGFVGLQPISVDGAGNVFVGDEDGARVFKFAPQADGDVAPVATISGSNTGLIKPASIVVGR